MDARSRIWLKVFFGPLMAVTGYVYRVYRANRRRVKALLRRGWAATLFKAFMILTLMAWLGVWLLASEESRRGLTGQVLYHLHGRGGDGAPVADRPD